MFLSSYEAKVRFPLYAGPFSKSEHGGRTIVQNVEYDKAFFNASKVFLMSTQYSIVTFEITST